MPKPHIAIFDLDRTLTRRGTFGRFVFAFINKPGELLSFLTASLWMQLKYKLGAAPRKRVKETMMARTISGLNREPLIARGHAFAKAEISHGLRVGARAVIARERMRGAKLLIASAAIDIIAAPIGAGLGFDAVIATPVSWDGNDRLIAKLPGENCYGLEKLNMVKNWLAARGYERENVTITAYSDSSSDLELLRFADIGIAVNPSAKLAQLAPQYGIEIQDWDQL